MPKLKFGTIVPTPEEEAAIQAGIAADTDTYELNDEEFAQLRQIPHYLKADSPKEFTDIMLDADVLEAFKATGKDWQTRINLVLRDWLETHRI